MRNARLFFPSRSKTNSVRGKKYIYTNTPKTNSRPNERLKKGKPFRGIKCKRQKGGPFSNPARCRECKSQPGEYKRTSAPTLPQHPRPINELKSKTWTAAYGSQQNERSHSVRSPGYGFGYCILQRILFYKGCNKCLVCEDYTMNHFWRKQKVRNYTNFKIFCSRFKAIFAYPLI